MIKAKWTFVVAAVLTSTTALAQESSDARFGQQGQFAISGERLFGITHTGTTASAPNGNDQTSSITAISFLSTPLALTGAGSVYSSPRVGFDYFVIDGLTLGMAFGVFSASTSVPTGNGSTQDGPTYSGVIVAPRVGYAYMFNDTVGIWPRGGFTYVGAGSKDAGNNPDESGLHFSAITLEVPLVITPFPHMGFLIAPTFDIGVGGSVTNKNGATGQEITTDVKATEIGAQAGMFVYL